MQILQTTGKEMFTMKRNTISEKKKQTYPRYSFFPFYASQRIAQSIEERKFDVFFIC